MFGRLFAKFAPLFKGQAVRGVLRIFGCSIVTVFALGAFQTDNWAVTFWHFLPFELSDSTDSGCPFESLEPTSGIEPLTSSLPWMRSTN